MLCFYRNELREIPSHPKSFILMAVAGSAFAFDMYIWNLSVLTIGAGLATVLANTQVFYMTLWGRLRGEESIDKPKLISLLMGILGLVLISTDAAAKILNPFYIHGVVLGLLAGFAYFLYIIFLRGSVKYRPDIDPRSSLMVSSLFCAFWLFIYSLISSPMQLQGMFEANIVLWIKVLFLAIFIHIGGWYFISRAFKALTPSVVGICLLLQPVLSSLWGSLFFEEIFRLQQIIGISLTLSAVAMIHYRSLL